MTLEFTEKQITELQKAQKEKRNALYHRLSAMSESELIKVEQLLDTVFD